MVGRDGWEGRARHYRNNWGGELQAASASAGEEWGKSRCGQGREGKQQKRGAPMEASASVEERLETCVRRREESKRWPIGMETTGGWVRDAPGRSVGWIGA